jgi:hypothetical protein
MAPAGRGRVAMLPLQVLALSGSENESLPHIRVMACCCMQQLARCCAVRFC